jgi:putative ABC transport system substrate-binding protein
MKKPALSSILVATLVLVLGVAAKAQQPKKVARICYLGAANASTSAFLMKPFRERLREIGYVEGPNLTIEFRHSEGKDERLPELAAELVRLNCDVIVTVGSGAAQAAKNATKSIPVVMGWGPDAVRRGILADLARPGGNVTGLTDMGAELYGKRLELLKQTVPKLARVVFLWNPSNQDAADDLKETETVARYLRVGIQFLEVKGPDDIEGAFRAATEGRANGLMLPGSGFLLFTESGS